MWEKLKELYEPHDGTTKLHTLDALFNMCVSQEEEEFFIFLATYEEAMDDAITASNLIPQDIKIGLEQNKLLELWGKFITMNSNIKSLPKLLTKILHEEIQRQKKAANQPMAMAASGNRYQQHQPTNRQRHKAWKGKAKLESNKSNNKNDVQRSYTYGAQQSGSFKVTCRYCKKDGHTERVC